MSDEYDSFVAGLDAFLKKGEEQEQRRKERAAERRQRLNAGRQEFMKRAKAERGCNRCGITDTRILDFHNPDGSRLAVRRVARPSWLEMQKRLEGCVVLCANCRRVVLSEEGESGVSD